MESYSSSARAEVHAALVVMIVLLLGSSGIMRPSFGCMEEEMNGLLLLKHAFNFATHHDYQFLPSWNPDRRNHECYCSWEGVVCSFLNNTARVTQLWLNQTRNAFTDRNTFSESLAASLSSQAWYLNASLFLPFEELQLLDLSANFLKGINGTLRLKKLRSLNLGDNYNFNHVPSLAELPSLKELHLQSNPLRSLLPLQGLKLEVLDLEGAGYSDPEYNISIIWEMMSLKALSLASSNNLDFSSEDLCGLVNLEELDISYNSFFNGLLPTCLANMTSLRALDFGYNNLKGTIPPSLFSSLSSLEYLSLSGNFFQGSISFASFGNSSKLEVFELVDNFYQMGIDTENPLYLPPISSQMKTLRISNCLLNKQNGGSFPSFLLTQHELIDLELSHCGVQGDFPNWLLENNTQLEYLNLMSNSIMGKLDLNSSLTLANLSQLDLSANHLEGTLPFNISSTFPNLWFLNMSNNWIHGSIPSFRDLNVLDLSSNNFAGDLPRGLFIGWASLYLLKLSDNFLSGRVPQLPREIDGLYLNNNKFTGDISPVLQNNSMLTVLDISTNLLKGAVPHLIGDIRSLEYLVLSDNNFKGSLPSSFCNLKNLQFLDLSSNDIGPKMPPCTNLSYVQHLHLQSTNLSGLFPKFLQRASSLVTLDLRGNALAGVVPPWVGMLSNLRVLVLQGNSFSGAIPQSICQLSKLSMLDLSANGFSGGVPSCLNNARFGKQEFYSDPFPLTTSRLVWTLGSSDCNYHGKLDFGCDINRQSAFIENFEEVNFLSKKRLETYKGTVLEYMSGLDLSSNKLNGSIPPEIGWLTKLRALNLSNNHLTGSIPGTFTHLEQIESLDLSFNGLNGEIPPQLTELYGLSVFSVAHNNLSGRIPEMKSQFSTFDQTSYEGNPFLCGLPLKSCDIDPQPQSSDSDNGETEVDPFKDVFWWSSAGAYLVVFIVTIFVLYLNNYYNSPGLFRL